MGLFMMEARGISRGSTAISNAKFHELRNFELNLRSGDGFLSFEAIVDELGLWKRGETSSCTLTTLNG